MGRRIGRQGAPGGGKGWWTIQDVVAGRSVVAVGGTVVPGDVVRKPLDKWQCCCGFFIIIRIQIVITCDGSFYVYYIKMFPMCLLCINSMGYIYSRNMQYCMQCREACRDLERACPTSHIVKALNSYTGGREFKSPCANMNSALCEHLSWWPRRDPVMPDM